MKKLALFVVAALALVAGERALAQGGDQWRKAGGTREYTSPQELVSIAPTTSLDKALAAISEISKKFTGKIIVDTEHRTMPINIDIQGMQWKDALEAICRKNDIWFTEYENYIQIGSGGGDQGKGQPGAITTTGPGASQGTVDIVKEPANFRSREVKISTVFFEVNLTKLDQVGINWSFMKSTSNVDINSAFNGASQVTNNIFKTEVTPHVSFANMDFIANLFSNYQLGEIMSSPEIVVRSGQAGRLQVGQDFSIRERDFAGNLIDKFYSAGTIAQVTPQVITEQGVNFIHMNIDVERSDVQPGAISTLINKTKATTNLLLLDGEETIIGGLYSSEVDQARVGVPFLKDLPWYVFGLRYLFGYNSDNVVKKELVILLKAELVPTLQERITKKTQDDGVFERWLQDQLKYERHLTKDMKPE
ncbi:MAG TPA: type II and III secretion system protein [Bacteroidota bacterium]|nr:type II and III secretion system protein [Bacteroidota bacterium]